MAQVCRSSWAWAHHRSAISWCCKFMAPHTWCTGDIYQHSDSTSRGRDTPSLTALGRATLRSNSTQCVWAWVLVRQLSVQFSALVNSKRHSPWEPSGQFIVCWCNLVFVAFPVWTTPFPVVLPPEMSPSILLSSVQTCAIVKKESAFSLISKLTIGHGESMIFFHVMANNECAEHVHY